MTKKYWSVSAVAIAAVMLTSCAMEDPFDSGSQARLTLVTEIRGDIKKTRAIENDEMTQLQEKLVVYIENNKGVIRKYKGLESIPASISLRTGRYVVEAWSGDSVSASFDKKFYRGWQEFQLVEGENTLSLNCNIANVLVSIDPASLDVDLTDLKVTFSHSRGSLEFTSENIGAKGYFMMPNADKDLDYKVEGKKADGSDYVKEGKIQNVERAHEYCMTISQDPVEISEGGAFIKLVIQDIPVIDEEVEIFSGPTVKGVGYELEKQVVSTNNSFTDTKVYVHAYVEMSSLKMQFSDNFTSMSDYDNVLVGSAISELDAKGIKVERVIGKEASSTLDGGEVNVDQVYVTFTKTFLDALPASDTEYKVTFTAVDDAHKTGTGELRIATSEAAVEHLAPVGTADAPDPETEPMAVLATTATLTGNIYEESEATNYGIMYREAGTSDWTAVAASSPSSAKRRAAVKQFTVKLTGLKMGTTYEYKTYCDGFDDCEIKTFTTESPFVIPNGSFEEWSTYSASTMLGTKSVALPSNTGNKLTSFWGSGNEGSATAGKTLTNKSEDMKHSGTYSARLASDQAVGVLAAGNVFVGHYDYTDGTNGVLQLGRPTNGTHPAKVRVWANYRPGTVDIVKSGNEQYLDFSKGENDHGQIYIALTDEPIEIRTNPSKQKLFSPDDVHVLAYNQVTWTENFGPDGQLEKIEIPFIYNERANNKRPTHIVIVACASKFGDFFSGSSSSVLYLDDFELVYE